MRVTEKAYTPFKKQYDVCCPLDTKANSHIIFADSQIRRFADSQIRRFADSQIRRFADSQIRRFADSQIRSLANASLLGFHLAKTSHSSRQTAFFPNHAKQFIYSHITDRLDGPFLVQSVFFRFRRKYESFFEGAISSCTGGKIG